MLRARVDDNDLVAHKVSLNESDPRLVAPTIAAKPPPSSKELLERKRRFIAPSKHAKSTSGQDLGEISFLQYLFHAICKHTMYIHLESQHAIMLSNKK